MLALLRARALCGLESATANNLLGVVGAELDKVMLAGSGTDQPLGVVNTVGITKTLGTSLTHANVQTMVKNSASANVNDENIRFLAPPAVRELLATRSIVGTAAERYIWQGGAVADKPAFVSGNVPSAQLYTGDFTRTWLLMWSAGIQLEVNPFAAFKSDIVGVRVVAYADVAITQPAAYHVTAGSHELGRSEPSTRSHSSVACGAR